MRGGVKGKIRRIRGKWGMKQVKNNVKQNKFRKNK
jgi:hypothetical protein